ARAMAAISGQRTSRSTSGSWIPTRSGRATRRSLRDRLAQLDRAARAAALLEVLLVVVLGRPERLGGNDLRHDRLAVPRLLALARRLGGRPLLLVVEEHHRAVLVADVPALTVALRRGVLAPEDVEQRVGRDALGVIRHLDDLRVTRRVRADVLVGRLVECPALVADLGLRHAVDLPERRLDAPEAARSERCLLLHLLLLQSQCCR